jgi:ABC-type amino acid transport substrate-binding protein
VWEGLSVELWEEIARQRDLDFEWVEMPLDATLAALEAGDVDVAAAALTITADRERRFDFSHAYYMSGLSLAYRAGGGSAWRATLRGFLSPAFLSAVGTLFLVLLAAGFVLWLFERRRNAEEFGRGRALPGIGDAFWWSAVTMTTVGYGDKAPKTFGGRIVALFWMFASLIIIAGLTASIAASLTTKTLQEAGLSDRPLTELKVGVLEESSPEAFARQRGAVTTSFNSIQEALAALSQGQVDVVLHDAPVLKYYVRTQFDGLAVGSKVLVREDYGFGLQANSPLREGINTDLLSVLRTRDWADLLQKHLGITNQ